MEMENKDVAMEKTDAVPIELPAPPGWKKRFTPGKSSTPRRNDIIFVSPDGDEIKNKRQLDKYLKSHPGGPPASEFNWGTGDTPRRSTRLGGKSKATETPETDTPSTKRQRKSSSKKEAKEDGGAREAEGATEKEAKASDEPALPDAEDLEVQDVEMASKNLTDGDNIKDEKEKTNDGEIVPKEPQASEDKMEIVHEKEETKDEKEKISDGEIVPEEPLVSEDKMEIVQEKEETKDEEEKTNACEIVPEEPPESEDKMEIVQEKEETKDEEEKTNAGEIVPEEPPESEDKMEIVQEKEETKDEEEKTNAGEIVPEEPPESEDKMEIVQEKEETKDEEEKTNAGEIVPEEPPESEDKMEIVQEKEETLDEGNIEKMKNREAEDKPLDNSLKTDNKTLPLNVFEENKIESKPAGTDASSLSAELSKASSGSPEEIAEEAPAAEDALDVVDENKIESKPAGADASSHSAELSKATSVSQEEAPAAADPLVQNSNDGKVHENEQIDREIPIEEIIGTESAAAGVNSSVQQ
ncbi:methyl-CpG-binding domain-containing protein 10-like [Solanum tuberosum]|uniref:Methyl binding domain protein MBD109 n=1 Tax=Solanum tuberosum TaxID=4113 RepID=M1BQF9_SOLTU|nr:PREDICTED: methyl-CpG-binding domain-containing protein 10-like [Solanum tuberosum]